MIAHPDCPLCHGEGMLPSHIDYATWAATWSGFQRSIADTLGIDVNNPPKPFCCQICDTGEIKADW